MSKTNPIGSPPESLRNKFNSYFLRIFNEKSSNIPWKIKNMIFYNKISKKPRLYLKEIFEKIKKIR